MGHGSELVVAPLVYHDVDAFLEVLFVGSRLDAVLVPSGEDGRGTLGGGVQMGMEDEANLKGPGLLSFAYSLAP